MQDIRQRLAAKLLPDDAVERCGFVMADGRIVEVKNIHESPEKGFRVAPKETLKAIKAKAHGTWHTHPKSDPNLSDEDYNCFSVWANMVHYIVGRREGKVVVTEFRTDDGVLVQL